MADLAVADASPLILLARSGWIELLRSTAPRIIVPMVVAAEMRQRAADEPAVVALATLAWIEIVETGPVDDRVAACALDPGESAVLTWALDSPGIEAILDEKLARRCAARLSIAHPVHSA